MNVSARDGLTGEFLLDLLGDQSDGGEQFHHDFDEYLSHGSCWGDFGIDVETIEEVFYRLEQVDERVVAGIDVFDRLINLYVTKTRME